MPTSKTNRVYLCVNQSRSFPDSVMDVFKKKKDAEISAKEMCGYGYPYTVVEADIVFFEDSQY